MANTLDILAGTADINRWHAETLPAIGTADWLTTPLVESGVLDYSFLGSRIAPIVVGVGSRRYRPSQENGTKTIQLKAKVDTDYLRQPPRDGFHPHEQLKKQVRDRLNDALNGNGKKPDITTAPGYVFPDVGGGVLFLDGILFDIDCTVENIGPAANVLGKAFDIGMICVGSEVLSSGEFSPPAPGLAVPSVVREALRPDRSGRISPTTQNFARAASYIRSIQ